MIPPNFERNDVIRECWEQHLTIEETAARTHIPKSSVGYFYKKLDRYAREGKPLPARPASRKEQVLQRLDDLELKSEFLKKVEQLEKKGNFAAARELILLQKEKEQSGLTGERIDSERKRLRSALTKIEMEDSA
ncbi:MAG TPA: hypothetical protein VN739_06305 [Nitrososphaerales archaeon]|nr:hypothetical protein [Nitrososphaerales archaeon]